MAHRLFQKIEYSSLNLQHKKDYNFQKVSSFLVDYGFVTNRPSEIWEVADLLAQHIEGKTCLRVILKNRLTFHKKHLHRQLYICFPEKNDWYLIPHDELLGVFLKKDSGAMERSTSWSGNGYYSFSGLSKKDKVILKEYKL